MQTADITTKEEKLGFIPGPYTCSPDPDGLAHASLKYLYTDLTDIRRYYIRLGFHLDEFIRNSYYICFGYLSLEDFCDANLGLDKSAVSRCINVYREFNASLHTSFENGVKIKGSAMELAPEWEAYSYSQLCEMLSLSPGQRKSISPDMSIKQIRKYKKVLKRCEGVGAGSGTASVATSQPEEKKLFNYEKFIKLNGRACENYIKGLDKTEDAIPYFFDCNGKQLYGNVWADFLGRYDNKYIFRLRGTYPHDISANPGGSEKGKE